MARTSKCTKLSRVLRTLEFQRKRKLTKRERKTGRKAAVQQALREVVTAEPVIFIKKSEFDENRKRSIREMADELYRQDHGGG